MNVETVLWSSIQELREDHETFRAEVLEALDVMGEEVQQHSRLRRNGLRILTFVWTDGGRILIFIGMLLFAVSGITGQLPKTLAMMLGVAAGAK